MRSTFTHLTLTFAAALALSAPLLSGPQQPPTPAPDHDHSAPAAAAETKTAPPMEMMARMKASDEKLQALVTRMNQARGAEKTDAIAELLTALVQEHRQMHGAMMTNMPGMGGMMKPGMSGDAQTQQAK